MASRKSPPPKQSKLMQSLNDVKTWVLGGERSPLIDSKMYNKVITDTPKLQYPGYLAVKTKLPLNPQNNVQVGVNPQTGQVVVNPTTGQTQKYYRPKITPEMLEQKIEAIRSGRGVINPYWDTPYNGSIYEKVKNSSLLNGQNTTTNVNGETVNTGGNITNTNQNNNDVNNAILQTTNTGVDGNKTNAFLNEVNGKQTERPVFIPYTSDGKYTDDSSDLTKSNPEDRNLLNEKVKKASNITLKDETNDEYFMNNNLIGDIPLAKELGIEPNSLRIYAQIHNTDPNQTRKRLEKDKMAKLSTYADEVTKDNIKNNGSLRYNMLTTFSDIARDMEGTDLAKASDINNYLQTVYAMESDFGRTKDRPGSKYVSPFQLSPDAVREGIKGMPPKLKRRFINSGLDIDRLAKLDNEALREEFRKLYPQLPMLAPALAASYANTRLKYLSRKK
jgi:hypothetical protein